MLLRHYHNLPVYPILSNSSSWRRYFCKNIRYF